MPTVLVATDNDLSYKRLLHCLSRETLENHQGVLRVDSLKEAMLFLKSARADILIADVHEGICPTGESGDLMSRRIREEARPYLTEERTGSGKDAVRAVREMIRYNYWKPDAAREYAEKVHLSLTYLCRIFKREVGQSIGDCILETRMNKAALLLAAGNHPVREVAESVGFWNFSYFCRRFRECYGVSPKEYRKRGKSEQIGEKNNEG
ncbi:MAG: helix-turn-helix domain-containing protein [Lachnospiraceae bacterium]|jgi:AraC-like DNA-binding protein|nr:helix-turn-helix domain-containing protein [Lachnospiraceae bacterium]MCI1726533.1 helix-turn-helix domain-containing protein [Lachnospiraceae bacterium]